MLQTVGCDFEIDSGAMEDRCGVCRGDGSTCHTVSRTFQKAEGMGMGKTTVEARWPFLVSPWLSLSPPRLGEGRREATMLGPGSKQMRHLAQMQ